MKRLKMSVIKKDVPPAAQPLTQPDNYRLLAKKAGAMLSLAAVLNMNYAPVVMAEEYIVSSGIINDGAIITSGNSQTVYGTTNNAAISSGGRQNVSSGGIANSTTVYIGGRQYIFAYGTANGTTVNSSGWQIISSGGAAIGATINSGGSQTVSSGGLANDATVYSGGLQNVFSGGTATSTAISGGSQSVYGTAIDTTVDGGRQSINNGGTASGTIVNNGGGQGISSGGTAIGATINSGGSQTINPGAVANDTIINSSGTQQVLNSGIANSTIIYGGYQNINNGGVANDTTVSGGTQTIFSGGLASGTTISGGSQNISSGGTASGTTINNGGQQRIFNSGVASDTTINNGGSQIVSNGGLANTTTINNSGLQVISNGGSAYTTTINSSGSQLVSSGGTANSTAIDNGGSQVVFNSGLSLETIINSGGSQIISTGGLTSDTIVNNGGSQIISNGGLANTTTINGGGSQLVSSGGTADLTSVNSGGQMHLYGGGSATNAILSEGAELAVWRGDSPAVYNNGTTDFTDKKLSFYLDGATGGDVLLSTDTPLIVTDATDITLLYSSSSNLGSGDTLTLVDKTTTYADFSQGSRTTSVYGGGATTYEFELFKDVANSNALKAAFQGINQDFTTENAKAYLEGAFSKLNHLNAAADTVEEGLQTAWKDSYGLGTFLTFDRGKIKAKTGSQVDSNYFILMGGVSNKKEFKNGRSLMTCVFLEGGWGGYDTYNSFSMGDVHGSGDTSHYGLGFSVKTANAKGNYLEGSLRTGRVDADFKTGDMGAGADFETKSTYWSAHIGLGRARQLKNGDVFDTYLKLFHTRQGSDNILTGAGEKLEFDSANSTRLRLGARYSKTFRTKSSYYAGLAWEYEFRGRQGGSIDGMRIDAPNMKGSSALIELGTKCDLSGGWSVDFSLQGLVGKRQGLGGNLTFNYKF